jgi:hypothetical protein
MAATATAPSAGATRTRTPDRFHLWATGANVWILAGLFLDGWSHINTTGEETFFTPWHGLLYSGVLAAVAVIVSETLRARRSGLAFRRAIPPGYGLSAVGGIVVLAGGAADGVWHELFGIEVGVEALLSPTHLTMAVAGVLVAAGPLRAAWHDARDGAPLRWFGIVGAALSVSLVGFFTQYVNPVTHRYPSSTPPAGETGVDLLHAAGIAGFVLWAALLAGSVLLVRHRWALPFGAVTALVAIPSLFLVTLRSTWVLLPGIVLAGVIGDVLAQRVGPRGLGTAVPSLVTSALLVTGALEGSLTWSVHLLTGAVVLSGAAGIFVSLLVAPPAVPDEAIAGSAAR